MLNTLRRGAKHFISKLILGFLVLTFIVWGVNDIIKDKGKELALTIGDTDYTKQEWYEFYKSQVAQLRPEYKELYASNPDLFKEHFLKQFIESELIKNEVNRLKIKVGDDAVKYEIMNNVPFFTRNGKFDNELLKNFLDQSNISENVFISKLKTSIEQRFLLDTLGSANILNNILLKQIVQALHSKAELEIYEPLIYSFKISEEPNDDQLQVILEENKKVFTVPEKRQIRFFKFIPEAPEKLIAEIKGEDILKFYQDNIHLFTLPEKRKFLKMVFADEGSAKSAHQKLLDGSDFTVLAKSFNQDPGLKNQAVTREGFEELLGDIIFSLEQGKISAPIKTPIGWCIFKITEIIPSFAQALDKIKPEIRLQLAKQRAQDNYSAIIQDIEQAISSNKSIEELAKSYNLKISSEIISIDQNSSKKDPILVNDKFLEVVFSLNENITSGVISSIPDQESFVVIVDKIEPEYVIVFDQIRSKLIELWKEKMQQQLARQALIEAREILSNNGKVDLSHVKVIKKTISIAQNDYFDPNNIIEIFSSPVGSITRIFDKSSKLFFVKIISNKDIAEKELVNKMQQEAPHLNNLRNLVVEDYLGDLQKSNPIKIYDTGIPNF
jgi:peptidyl-prolyl cis-trans isomerase D